MTSKGDINKFGSGELKAILDDIKSQKQEIEKKRQRIEKLEKELVDDLSKASKFSVEDAKNKLLSTLEKSLKEEIAQKIRIYTDKLKQEASEKAKEILIDAMKHGATSYVAEYTVSAVSVPNEDTKGRIIGREGRNIRTFEQETGVEVVIDETNEIKLSSYDSVRREIARRALTELVKDARIQPSRIEEVVALTRKQMDDVLLEEGKRIADECRVYNLPTDIVRYIGKFKFRTSFGQNLALHTIEETKMGASIAAEIGADEEIVRLGCLLHDIGKVVPGDGAHVELGVNVLKKHGFPKEVVACVAEHHEDKPFSSIESVIVWIADAISGSRPGARYEQHEDYVKSMDKIEDIAKEFDGVDKAYAFQAGRDVRVIVNPKELDDDDITILARNIAKKLETDARYAGQIKVTVIREVRASDTTAAK